MIPYKTYSGGLLCKSQLFRSVDALASIALITTILLRTKAYSLLNFYTLLRWCRESLVFFIHCFSFEHLLRCN